MNKEIKEFLLDILKRDVKIERQCIIGHKQQIAQIKRKADEDITNLEKQIPSSEEAIAKDMVAIKELESLP